MKFKKANLYTSNLAAERDFYTTTLGLDLIQSTSTIFIVRVGWTELSFTASPDPHRYHYCFLVPCNLFSESLEWMRARADIIEVYEGELAVHFDNWNAKSFYFYDASGNIVEFIARYDLGNAAEGPFGAHHILGLNEIGFPVRDIAGTDSVLSDLLGTQAWKGNDQRFGTNGDQEALILLPNYDVKETWFPTDHRMANEPFELVVQERDRLHYLQFERESVLRLPIDSYMSSE